MTTYFLSTNAGLVPNQANVSEATSSPSADVQLNIGGGTVPAANLSRSFVVSVLQSFIAYILADDKRAGGTAVLPLTE